MTGIKRGLSPCETQPTCFVSSFVDNAGNSVWKDVRIAFPDSQYNVTHKFLSEDQYKLITSKFEESCLFLNLNTVTYEFSENRRFVMSREVNIPLRNLIAQVEPEPCFFCTIV